MKKPAPHTAPQSAAASRELRTAALHVKVKPSVKAAADAMAADDRRSVADWISLLIEAEHERRTKAKGKSG